MLKALDHVALVVEDLDAAVAGYEALLGRKARGGRFQLSNAALTLEVGEGSEGIRSLGFTGAADPGETYGVDIRLVQDEPPPPSPFVGEEAAAVSGVDDGVGRDSRLGVAEP